MNGVLEKQVTKVQITITLLLILFFCVTGATYAYFAFTVTNDTITGEAATVNLSLDVTRVFPSADSENTGVMVPQLSNSGNAVSPLDSALKYGCVDANTNIVCQVYKVVVKNDGGTATQVVDGSILFYSDSELTTDVSVAMPNLKWKLVSSVDAVTPANSVLGANVDLDADAVDNVFADDVIMVTDSSFTYYIIVWINETNDDQPLEPGNSFYGKIIFNSSNGTGVMSAFTA